MNSRSAAGQRSHLPEPALQGGMPRLPASAGIHHALHARAEWAGREILPEPEGGMRLAAKLRELRRGPHRHRPVDRLVQPRQTSSGPWLQESEGVPSRSLTRGLISGEHYKQRECGSESEGSASDPAAAIEVRLHARPMNASGGPLTDPSNPFFQSLGTNGRSCDSCHVPEAAMTVTPEECFKPPAAPPSDPTSSLAKPECSWRQSPPRAATAARG